MKPPNKALANAGERTNCPDETASEITRKSKVPLANAEDPAVAAYNPINAASMISPPKRL